MNVNDFDNTKYDGESAVDFFLFCMRRYPSMIKLLPLIGIKLIKYKRCRISIEELEYFVSKYAKELLDKIKDVEGLVSEFWDKNMNKVKDFYKSQRKEDDLILSATADFLLKEFSKRMKINYICSEIDLKTAQIHRICFRSNKAEILNELYPDIVIENFYTDSMNDKPIINMAKNAFLVKGNKIKKIK